jgi:hypothetical protein
MVERVGPQSPEEAGEYWKAAIVASDEYIEAMRVAIAALTTQVEDLRRKLFPYADATEISGMSWDGYYLIGDRKSLDKFNSVMHRADQLEVYRKAYDEHVARLITQVEELTRANSALNDECQRSMDTIAAERKRAEAAERERNRYKELADKRNRLALSSLSAADTAIRDLRAALATEKENTARLREAADYIAPYLIWTVGDESPGHHPTMPSAVSAFLWSFDIGTPEKRLERTRARMRAALSPEAEAVGVQEPVVELGIDSQSSILSRGGRAVMRAAEGLLRKQEAASPLIPAQDGLDVVAHPYEDWRAAINFAIETDEPQAFLRAWNHGEWSVLDDEWPEWKEYLAASTPSPIASGSEIKGDGRG